MKGYVLGLLYMDNWDWYEKYLPETAKLIEEHGGKYLASGVKPDMKEGIDQPSAYVLLEFPDVTSAQNWYNRYNLLKGNLAPPYLKEICAGICAEGG